jgi:hypothetical protein
MQRTKAWFRGDQIYQMQRIEANLSDTEDRGHGSRGSMSDMISVLHQSVAINAKGGDC